MIPLAVPNLSGNESQYLKECIRTNFVSSVGQFVTNFEKLVVSVSGAKYGVATNSGTSGLHVALTSVGVQSNDLVILPSFTFIASANAIRYCGADPWIFDVSPESWSLDPILLAECLKREAKLVGKKVIHRKTNQRIAAIMPVYALGLPADMDPIMEIGRKYDIPVIADGAAALGARYKNRDIGNLADLTVFSFNGNKTITAGGGGAVVGNNKRLLDFVRRLSTTARIGSDYDHDHVGFNYRMTNLQAAVGCAQLEKLEELVEAKRKIQKNYNKEFANVPGIQLFPEPDWGQSACWISGIVIRKRSFPSVKRICGELLKRGIQARSFWKPIHLQVPYKKAPRTQQRVSEGLFKKIIALPCSTQLSKKEQVQVIQAVKKVIFGE